MKGRSFYFVCSLIIFLTCYFTWRHQWANPPYSPEINAVLFMAGDNRNELEQVLKHYSQNPADSLKLRAAEFLIVNMPGKYSKYYDAPWNDVATVRLRWTSSPNKQLVLDTYGLGEPVKRDDVKYITAKYLINNIDLAFKAWRERPWGKHIPFDIFCEEILPYRVDTEPLENWREKAIASFAGLNTILNKPGMTSVEACQKVNDLLPKFRLDSDFPPMSYSQLMASSRGPCDAMAALTVFSMRALGIPVTIDFIPKWAYSPTGHSWNAVCDSAGQHISFMGTDTGPGEPHQGNTLVKSKVYRKTFAKQRNILTDERNIPPLLRSNSMKDVSSEYADCTDTVTIDVKYPDTASTGYVYLAIEQRGELYPIAWAVNNGQTVRFASVGRSVVYHPMYYANGVATPAGDPFLLSMDKYTAVDEGKSLQPKGLWLFSDSSNLGKAALGKPLLLNGNGISAAEAGTVRVDKDSYFRCNHGIAATKNRTRVNEYTLMIDFKINNTKQYYTFLQTGLTNDNDGELFIHPDKQVGILGYYAGNVSPNQWNRYVVTVNCGAKGEGVFRQYLNGFPLNEVPAGQNNKLNVDSRFSLDTAGCLLFADDDGEDNEILIDAVAIWDRALSIREVTTRIDKTGVYDWAL
ncbi:MAG: LamG domain-containing protein [Bacteroidales bacterium]|jgi:hypothetical protein|nr:LamG domain-containing protein [Bacteroidales bacterium]